MADHFPLDNDSGFDSSIETDLREMLAAAACGGLGQNATHRPDLAVEMAAQRGLAAAAQAAGTIFDDITRNLRHAGCGRAGAW